DGPSRRDGGAWRGAGRLRRGPRAALTRSGRERSTAPRARARHRRSSRRARHTGPWRGGREHPSPGTLAGEIAAEDGGLREPDAEDERGPLARRRLAERAAEGDGVVARPEPTARAAGVEAPCPAAIGRLLAEEAGPAEREAVRDHDVRHVGEPSPAGAGAL